MVIPILLWFARSLGFTLKGQQSRLDGYIPKNESCKLEFVWYTALCAPTPDAQVISGYGLTSLPPI